ncbi:MAG TPA: trypsin-like peptidase domain-containing protein [Balneolaceae bacterium]|nr:trypsin-like peptidase domain-containing protein [Balneolaceae bacterium]
MSYKIILPYLFILIFGLVSCTHDSSRGSVTPVKQIQKAKSAKSAISSHKKGKVRNVNASDSSLTQGRRDAITRAVKRVSPAVVSITVTEQVNGNPRVYRNFFNHFFAAPSQREYKSMGSGFIISKNGLVVTNQHVVSDNAKKIVVSLTDGSQYQAKIIGTSELDDLALLKIEANRTFPVAHFGNSNKVIVGEWALAIGNPFGLFKAAQPSVTVGVVSALHRDFRPNPKKPRVYMDMIQTDAAINSGNSGGPLVDSQGKVIGVNTFIYTGGTSNGFVGLGFAIPSNRAKKIIKELKTNGKVEKGYDLGMKTTPMTYPLAAKNSLPRVVGLFVTSVNKDGPAFKSGIIPGDIIVKIGNQRVQSPMHAKALMREYSVGDTMSVQLIRNNKLYKTKIKLRKKITEK